MYDLLLETTKKVFTTFLDTLLLVACLVVKIEHTRQIQLAHLTRSVWKVLPSPLWDFLLSPTRDVLLNPRWEVVIQTTSIRNQLDFTL